MPFGVLAGLDIYPDSLVLISVSSAQLLDAQCILPLVVAISGRVGSDTAISCEFSGLRGVIVEETVIFLEHNFRCTVHLLVIISFKPKSSNIALSLHPNISFNI